MEFARILLLELKIMLLKLEDYVQQILEVSLLVIYLLVLEKIQIMMSLLLDNPYSRVNISFLINQIILLPCKKVELLLHNHLNKNHSIETFILH